MIIHNSKHKGISAPSRAVPAVTLRVRTPDFKAAEALLYPSEKHAYRATYRRQHRGHITKSFQCAPRLYNLNTFIPIFHHGRRPPEEL